MVHRRYSSHTRTIERDDTQNAKHKTAGKGKRKKKPSSGTSTRRRQNRTPSSRVSNSSPSRSRDSKEDKSQKETTASACPVSPGQTRAVDFGRSTFTSTETKAAGSLWSVMADEPATTVTHVHDPKKYRQHFGQGLEKLGTSWTVVMLRLKASVEQALRTSVLTAVTAINKDKTSGVDGSSVWLPRLDQVFRVYDNFLKDENRLLRLIGTQYRLKQKTLRSQAVVILIEMYGPTVVTLARRLAKAQSRRFVDWDDAKHQSTVVERQAMDQQWFSDISLGTVPVLAAMDAFWTHVSDTGQEHRQGGDGKESTKEDSNGSKREFAWKTTKLLASTMVWYGAAAVVNLVWIGSLSNLKGQSNEFLRGAFETVLTEFPTWKAVIDIWIGRLVPLASDQTAAVVTSAVAATPYLGWAASYVGAASGTVVSAFKTAANVVGATYALYTGEPVAEFQYYTLEEGLLPQLATIINTTAGVYFSSITQSIVSFLAKGVYSCLSWVFGATGSVWPVVGLVVLYLIVNVALNAYSIWTTLKWATAPLRLARNLWNSILVQLRGASGTARTESEIHHTPLWVDGESEQSVRVGGSRHRLHRHHRQARPHEYDRRQPGHRPRRSAGNAQHVNDQLWQAPPTTLVLPSTRVRHHHRRAGWQWPWSAPKSLTMVVANETAAPVYLLWYDMLTTESLDKRMPSSKNGRIIHGFASLDAVFVPANSKAKINVPQAIDGYRQDLLVVGAHRNPLATTEEWVYDYNLPREITFSTLVQNEKVWTTLFDPVPESVRLYVVRDAARVAAHLADQSLVLNAGHFDVRLLEHSGRERRNAEVERYAALPNGSKNPSLSAAIRASRPQGGVTEETDEKSATTCQTLLCSQCVASAAAYRKWSLANHPDRACGKWNPALHTEWDESTRSAMAIKFEECSATWRRMSECAAAAGPKEWKNTCADETCANSTIARPTTATAAVATDASTPVANAVPRASSAAPGWSLSSAPVPMYATDNKLRETVTAPTASQQPTQPAVCDEQRLIATRQLIAVETAQCRTAANARVQAIAEQIAEKVALEKTKLGQRFALLQQQREAQLTANQSLLPPGVSLSSARSALVSQLQHAASIELASLQQRQQLAIQAAYNSEMGVCDLRTGNLRRQLAEVEAQCAPARMTWSGGVGGRVGGGVTYTPHWTTA